MERSFISIYEVLLITTLPLLFSTIKRVHIKEDNQVPFSATRVMQNDFFEGKGIYDPNWNKVKIIFNKDRTLSFSSNSTAAIQKIARGMAKTKIGLKTLMLMDVSYTKTTIEIDTINIILNSEGNNIAAETSPIISTRINEFSRTVGQMYISTAKIVIYEAAIKDIASNNGGKISINGVIIDTTMFSISDIIASYAIHEFIHVLDNRNSSSLNPKATRAEIEKKPYEYQLQHFKEFEEQKD